MCVLFLLDSLLPNKCKLTSSQQTHWNHFNTRIICIQSILCVLPSLIYTYIRRTILIAFYILIGAAHFYNAQNVGGNIFTHCSFFVRLRV